MRYTFAKHGLHIRRVPLVRRVNYAYPSHVMTTSDPSTTTTTTAAASPASLGPSLEDPSLCSLGTVSLVWLGAVLILVIILLAALLAACAKPTRCSHDHHHHRRRRRRADDVRQQTTCCCHGCDKRTASSRDGERHSPEATGSTTSQDEPLHRPVSPRRFERFRVARRVVQGATPGGTTPTVLSVECPQCRIALTSRMPTWRRQATAAWSDSSSACSRSSGSSGDIGNRCSRRGRTYVEEPSLEWDNLQEPLQLADEALEWPSFSELWPDDDPPLSVAVIPAVSPLEGEARSRDPLLAQSEQWV